MKTPIDPRFYIALGPLALEDIIATLDVEPIPDSYSSEAIETLSPLSGSTPGSLSFLASRKHADDLVGARASACFVEAKNAHLVSACQITPIISKTPRAHFGRAAMKLYQPRELASKGHRPTQISERATIHPTAIIGEGVVIEADVQIAPYTVIDPGVHIGQGTKIGAHTSVSCAVIGPDCIIEANVCLGGAGFGIAADERGVIDIPHLGRVMIGTRVRIGSQSCIDRGQLGDTAIGDDTKIDNLVQVAHNVQIGARCFIAGHVGISGSCTVGNDVVMGGNVGLADHLTIGDKVQIAARAGVMHNIPAGEIWSGIPAQPIRDHMRMISATRKLIKKPKRSGPDNVS